MGILHLGVFIDAKHARTRIRTFKILRHLNTRQKVGTNGKT